MSNADSPPRASAAGESTASTTRRMEEPVVGVPQTMRRRQSSPTDDLSVGAGSVCSAGTSNSAFGGGRGWEGLNNPNAERERPARRYSYTSHLAIQDDEDYEEGGSSSIPCDLKESYQSHSKVLKEEEQSYTKQLTKSQSQTQSQTDMQSYKINKYGNLVEDGCDQSSRSMNSDSHASASTKVQHSNSKSHSNTNSNSNSHSHSNSSDNSDDRSGDSSNDHASSLETSKTSFTMIQADAGTKMGASSSSVKSRGYYSESVLQDKIIRPNLAHRPLVALKPFTSSVTPSSKLSASSSTTASANINRRAANQRSASFLGRSSFMHAMDNADLSIVTEHSDPEGGGGGGSSGSSSTGNAAGGAGSGARMRCFGGPMRRKHVFCLVAAALVATTFIVLGVILPKDVKDTVVAEKWNSFTNSIHWTGFDGEDDMPSLNNGDGSGSIVAGGEDFHPPRMQISPPPPMSEWGAMRDAGITGGGKHHKGAYHKGANHKGAYHKGAHHKGGRR